MLLLSMTLEELKKEFLKNRYIVEAKHDNRQREMVHLSRKTKKFPCAYKFLYPNVNGNDYLVMQYFYKKNAYVNSQNKYIVIGLINTDRGIYAVRNVSSLDGREKNLIERYQPHFFSRYKKRCGKKSDGVDLIAAYFNHNDLINPKYEEKVNPDGSIHYSAFARCSEGIVLGNYEPDTKNIIWNTFVTDEMLSRIQNRYKERLDSNLSFLKELGLNELTVAEHSFFTI